MMRQSGHCFELATALCSLLLGLGYDAYVVSGYAVQDVTTQTMCRVDSPFPPSEEAEGELEEGAGTKKYAVKPPRDLRSKFLLMMEQREKDKVKAAEDKLIAAEQNRRRKEEEPPIDELEGLRIHGWVMLLTNGREIEKPTFIEPSTGTAHDFSTSVYSGIESVWNHLNYWVNMQDCSNGLDKIDYDLTNVSNWEYLLPGEPINLRKESEEFTGMDEEDLARAKIYEEKHLDMPMAWSLRMCIPHDALTHKFPGGFKATRYKRCIVNEYAPYVNEDGLVAEINRFDDFDCTDLRTVECRYENRHDKLVKTILNVETTWIVEYFDIGRDDSVIKHQYCIMHKEPDDDRIIDFNDVARHDGLSKIEVQKEFMAVHYKGRDDKIYYRDVTFAKKGFPPPGMLEGHRRIIVKLTEKFDRDDSKPASRDIATREYLCVDRIINLKYHYGPGKVTASTRQFIKPPVAEMGERLKFSPELTSGYKAEIDAPPPTNLQLFILLQQQLEQEEESLCCIRDTEDQVAEFVMLRGRETTFNKLDISLFNMEQNVEYREGMLEREKQNREMREKEVEEEMDYLLPQLARLGYPSKLTYEQAKQVRHGTLEDFKTMLLNRAHDLQKQFEVAMEQLQGKKQWYLMNQDLIAQEEEVHYFEDLYELNQLLRVLEIRLARHRDLSSSRYKAMVAYLDVHPMLAILHGN